MTASFPCETGSRPSSLPLFLELHVVLNDADDVCLSFEIVDESLGVTHCALELANFATSREFIVSTQPP